MTNTYVQTSLGQVKDNNRTTNYQYNNHFEMKLMQMDTVPGWKEWTYNLTGLTGSTNVISNIIDLASYDQALYTGTLINASSLEEAFTPTKLNNGQNNKAANGSSYGLGWFIKDDSITGKTVSHSGAAPGVSTLLVRNLSKKQTVIILHNIQGTPEADNTILDILNDKPVQYKVSLAFAYARNLYLKGIDYSASFFSAHRMDTLHYYLREQEMDRAGLEFSRKSFQVQALETYKLNTLLFPESWRTFNSYGNALLKNGKKEEALLMLEQSIALNPNDENGKTAIKQLKD
jgi:tetratricopeptide (TPR) repeat protein